MSAVANKTVDRNVVPFYGRAAVIQMSSPQYSATLQKLVQINDTVVSISKSKTQEQWKVLERDVTALLNHLMNPDQTLMLYQLELIRDGLLPYLGSLNGRLHVDNNRFKQIGAIIQSIMHSGHEHPAFLLQSLDEQITDIRNSSKFNLWKSELLSSLEVATEKQWQPIVADNRRLLQDYGGKLLVLGLVGVVGWPVAFLYPLYKLSITLLAIVQEWEHKKTLSRQSLFELVKTIAMLVAATQVLSILAVYASLGNSCLLLGAAALVVSSNASLVKKAAPVLAPHLAQIDKLMTAVGNVDLGSILPSSSAPVWGSGEGGAGGARAGAGISGGGGSSRFGGAAGSGEATYVSERVEVLVEEDEPVSGKRKPVDGSRRDGSGAGKTRASAPSDSASGDEQAAADVGEDGSYSDESTPRFPLGMRKRT